MQYRDENRAVVGKGPYKVRPEFQHLVLDDKTWSKMSHEQLMAKVEKYFKSGMGAKKVMVDKEIDNSSRFVNNYPSHHYIRQRYHHNANAYSLSYV